MVQNLTLSVSNIHRGNMSINSSIGSIDSPTSSVENDVIAFQEIPLTALSNRTLRKLSNLLNSKKILRSEEGYERDWRGLASLAKQKNLCDENIMSGDDAMTKVIQLWCSNNPKTATFGYLEKFLGIIDRWDASDDIYENLVEDMKAYQTKQHCLQLKSDNNAVQQSTDVYDDFGHGSDPNILTTADVIRAQKGLTPQKYDAFVLYADADLNYATEMLTKLEDNLEYNFKLCLKDRDLLGGVQFEHVALTQLIEERCKHLIVILTDEFLKSPENTFLVNYTQAVQIAHNTRKIIPLLYEETVDIPRTLKIYTHLRYSPVTASLFNFWTKLANSIRDVSVAAADAISPSPTYRNDIYSTSTMHSETSDTAQYYLKNLPTPPIEIPSISIIPPDDNEKPKKKERSKLKHSTMRHNRSNALLNNDGMILRNAHSTGQLHTSYQTNTNTASMSDLSTSSICSETKKKTKKKWPSKFLKKVFSRSSSKLQETS